MKKTITIGDRQVDTEQITEVAIHLGDMGSCCVDVAVGGHGQARHEVVQFGADSDGATDFACTLMNLIWEAGWLFLDLKRYKDGISWCHGRASVVEADIAKQRSWLFVAMPNLNVHSVVDERNQEYEVCAGTPWEGAM